MNLKEYLSTIYSGDFDFLSNRKEKIVKNYIENNINKAYAVIGEYDNEQEFQVQYFFNDFNGLRIYLNKEGLIRIATNSYSLSLESIKDNFTHLTNTGINIRNKKYHYFLMSKE